MDKNAFRSYLQYQSIMTQVRNMLAQHLISSAECRMIDTHMCKKYGINLGSIYRPNEWITFPVRGNMASEKEVS